MESQGVMWSSIRETAILSFEGFVSYLPSLIGALAVLLFGWALARLVRAGSTQILKWINRVLERTLKRGILSNVRLPIGASTIFGEIAYWIVIFISLTIAARVAQLPAISRWLDEIVSYLPNILFGIATIVVGYVIANLVGGRVTDSARASKSSQSVLLGRLSQTIVFVIALIIGLDQIGVNVSVFVTLAAVALGATLVGFSIAFGLGAREFVSDLISARSYRQSLNPGLVVRIGDIQGEILEITQTEIALDTEIGRALVPARKASETGIVIISSQVSVGGDDA